MDIWIMDILEQTMADGPGFRTAIYCAGCLHHCPGCHNPQSWDRNNGHPVSVDDLMEVIKSDDLSNVSFSGGDPFYGKLSMLLPYLDVLVDGPFIHSLRDTSLLFRGSSNQNIIYLKGKPDDTIPGTVPIVGIH